MDDTPSAPRFYRAMAVPSVQTNPMTLATLARQRLQGADSTVLRTPSKPNTGGSTRGGVGETSPAGAPDGSGVSRWSLTRRWMTAPFPSGTLRAESGGLDWVGPGLSATPSPSTRGSHVAGPRIGIHAALPKGPRRPSTPAGPARSGPTTWVRWRCRGSPSVGAPRRRPTVMAAEAGPTTRAVIAAIQCCPAFGVGAWPQRTEPRVQ
jgi:hypothetical protein